MKVARNDGTGLLASLTPERPIIPALDTLFIAVEDIPGYFREAYAQCSQCILGKTKSALAKEPMPGLKWGTEGCP